MDTSIFMLIVLCQLWHRIGAKAIRKYDSSKTPYQQILENDTVSKKVKDDILSMRNDLNLTELKRKINECQSRLKYMAAPIRAPLEVIKIRQKRSEVYYANLTS